MRKPMIIRILLTAVIACSVVMTTPGAYASQKAHVRQGLYASSIAQAPTASEIIERMEQNTDFKTAYYEARMESRKENASTQRL